MALLDCFRVKKKKDKKKEKDKNKRPNAGRMKIGNKARLVGTQMPASKKQRRRRDSDDSYDESSNENSYDEGVANDSPNLTSPGFGCNQPNDYSGGTFNIDTKRGIFMKDGQPFKYVSGSFHYFRIPQMYWSDRLLKYKAAGLDAVQIYIPWNFHEAKPGEFNFMGPRNLTHLFQMVKEHDLLLILRPGPYICAEWDFGGLPGWLLNKNPKMILRSEDKDYMKFVYRWMDKLLPLVKPFLYENNGPVIMLQIENEYGSYPTCSESYMSKLVANTRRHLGNNLILFTTDGNGAEMIKCGRIPPSKEADNNIITVNFGATDNPEKTFAHLDSIQPNKPLINSEMYFGWLSHWGEKRIIMSDSDSKSLQKIYEMSDRTNINIYMFHGGTNFGLTNGANAWPYDPQITSYDYGAPLSENGDMTSHYMFLREIIHKMKGKKLPPLPETLKNVTTVQHPTVRLKKAGFLLSTLDLVYKYANPISMEEFEFYEQGLVVYSTNIPTHLRQKQQLLSLSFMRDNAQIFSSTRAMTKFRFLADIGANMISKKKHIDLGGTDEILHIVVENQGRINYAGGMQGDFKGLKGEVKLEDEVLLSWSIQTLGLFQETTLKFNENDDEMRLGVFEGEVKIEHDKNLGDTFALVSAKAKGMIIINEVILGRFDTQRGPQLSLYAPKNFFRLGTNKIRVVVLESYGKPVSNLELKLLRNPVWTE